MKLIPLTRGFCAMVDDDMFDILNQFKWYTEDAPRTWYARTNAGSGKTRTTLKMERFILMCAGNVDHWDGNGINNVRANLRISTLSQNHGNQKKTRSPATSRFKGVTWARDRGKWRAYIGTVSRGTRVNLGQFCNENEAAMAYDQAARRRFGEFARLNFPDKCR